jgi:hypothetical protein
MLGPDGAPVIGDDGKPMQQVIYETVSSDYVEWDMVRFSPAKRWSKLRWIAFGELLTRDELKKQFGDDKGGRCTLNWSPKDKENEDEMFKRALVWSVWDKDSRRVHVVSAGLPGERLAVIDDPLKLEGFWPCPRPVYAVKTTGTMCPVPEYTQYQDQAIELDDLTARINVLVDALRRRGIYNATFSSIEKLASAWGAALINCSSTKPSQLEPAIGWPSNASPFDKPSKAWTKPLSRTYTLGERIKRLPTLPCHAGKRRTSIKSHSKSM